jgi:hypothetical protein
MYKIGQPISRIDFYRLAPLGLEAKYNGNDRVKIYSTKTKEMCIQIGDNVKDFEFYRNAIETDLIQGNFLISKLPNYPLLKRKPNV